MSTFTKEQLIARINQVTAINKYHISRDPDADGLAMDNELLAIALASLEAEPVFEVEVSGNRWLNAGPVDDSDFSGMPDGVNQLYSAPPAPVSVPDAATAIRACMEEFPESVHDIVEECAAIAENSCRAAMIQGAERVSNRDELPDGWVACSERMPEDGQEVITHNIFGYRHVSFFDEHSGHFFDRLDGSPVDCVEHVLVSHWMPLPAAPQQEA